MISPSYYLKGRPLREQQEVAAAVIQRCYRKYKQVNLSLCHRRRRPSLQSLPLRTWCGVWIVSTTQKWFALPWLKTRETGNETKPSAVQFVPQKNLCSESGPSVLSAPWDIGLIQGITCVWSEDQCLSNFIGCVVIEELRRVWHGSWRRSVLAIPLDIELYRLYSLWPFSVQLLLIHLKMKNCKKFWES